MIEYISRQDAIRTIRAYFENLPWNGLATTVADDCEKLLNDIPTADVRENIKGKWELRGVTIMWPGGHYYCSQCGAAYDGEYYFCPNCGADMRGKKRWLNAHTATA